MGKRPGKKAPQEWNGMRTTAVRLNPEQVHWLDKRAKRLSREARAGSVTRSDVVRGLIDAAMGEVTR